MTNDLADFEQFTKQREASSMAYVQGDPKPLGQMVTHASPASFFSPQGGYHNGVEDV